MYLKLAWRNIWRNKRRTLITLSSIGFAVFFACIMQSMQLGSYERMIDNAVRFSTGHVQVHANGFWENRNIDRSLTWNEAFKEQVLVTEDIEAMTPRLESFALGAFEEKTKGVLVIGIDPDQEEKITSLSNKVVEGAYFDTDQGALIGKDLARFLNIRLGDTLIMISQGYHGVNAAGKFPVEGILHFPNPMFNQQAVCLKLPTAQFFYGAQNQITSLSLLLEEADKVEYVEAALKSKLDTAVYEVMDWRAMMPELVQSIELDFYGGLIMIFILYIVIAFGIFGTFLMMTKERTHEFGVMTAIGMRKLKIETMVILEIVMLTLLGVASGIALSLPILTYFHLNPLWVSGGYAEAMEKFGMEPIIPFSLDPSLFLRQGIIILVIGIILSIYPMIAIHSLKTSKALKA